MTPDVWDAWPSRVLPDGRKIALEPMIWDGWRMHVVALVDGPDGDMTWADRSTEMFTFPTYASGATAFLGWMGAPGTEPDGWVRHQPSNRRRTDGDPDREYVAS